MPTRVAVFASGGGTNLQALLDRFAQPGTPGQVALVVAGRPGIGAARRAAEAGVPSRVWQGDDGAQLVEMLTTAGVDLVVLAGWLRRIPAEVVKQFAERMVNIHPALLPAFGGPGMYGLHVHRAVLAAGARVSGATVHLVDDEYDTGRILAQWPVPVLPSDTPEILAARVLLAEHRLLPAVVEAMVRGEDPSGASWAPS